ncbi:MAG TPA: acyl-CoA dehydrogenase family protein [Candidatus Limnocylindria bacterium]|nr:acyl-CoA dehydrogenase family protein [Candidatus Limnocylindria bacterium]
MDFRATDEERRFRAEVREWLLANLPAGWNTPGFPKPEEPGEKVAFARRWQRTLYEGGWAGLHWPREYGGRGATPLEQFLFAEEYTRLGAPPMIDIGVGPGLVGPTLIHHGTDEQKRRFLPRILTGEDVWCQGFSEPNAGSDLANCRTRAELVGDVFHVTGQKIWTSYARFADWCILLVRTDPQAPKHKGLTFLLVDMKSPGITIRPLVEMTGVAWFNEVFFDDVRVPRANMVGRLNDGWTIAITTLAHERTGSAPHARLAEELADTFALARSCERHGVPATKDALYRQRLAQSYIDVEVVRLVAYRQVWELMRTGHPGPEGSYLKLLWSEADVRMKELAIEIEGAYGVLQRGCPRAVDAGRWQYEYLWSRAATIYAGTSEVQRNIISQRVLGLPRGG